MNKPDKMLRERLLDMETRDVSQKEMHERQVKAMLEKKLSVWARIGLGLLAGIGLLAARHSMGILRTYLPLEGMSNSVTYTFVLTGLVLALVWTGLTGYLAVRGRFGSIVRPALVVGVGVAMAFFFVVMHTFFSNVCLMAVKPTDWVLDWRVRLNEWLAIAVLSMVTLIGICLILRVAYRIEFKTQEKLLKIEYRLAELAEKIAGRQSD